MTTRFKNIDLKKWKIISIFVIFGLSALFHFIYQWVPSFFTSLLFPVNESIWEHNKIIIGSFLIWSIFEKITIRKHHDLNTCTSGFISAVICCILVMLIFSPIYFYILKTNDNTIVTLTVYFICIAISVYINYKLLQRKYNPEIEKKVILLWLLVIVINAILTYYHPKLPKFYDYNKNIYGLKN